MEKLTNGECTQLINTWYGITPKNQDQEDFMVQFAYIFDVLVKDTD